MSETSNKKVAVVTGSNRGIGLEVVKGLCKKFDGDVYLTARNVENGKKAIEELEKEGYHAKFHELDIEKTESIENLAKFLKETYGGLDVLVNNAAIYLHDKNIPKEKAAEETIRMNYFATLNAIQILSPLIRSNGRLVNVSSRLGLLNNITNNELKSKLTNLNRTVDDVSEIMNLYVGGVKEGNFKQLGFPDQPYNVSKVGINSLGYILQKSFDNDSSRTGIIVSTVCPGYCKTGMTNGGGLLTAEQGAETIIQVCLFPDDFSGPKGAFWAETNTVDWENKYFITAALSMFKKFFASKFF